MEQYNSFNEFGKSWSDVNLFSSQYNSFNEFGKSGSDVNLFLKQHNSFNVLGKMWFLIEYPYWFS